MNLGKETEFVEFKESTAQMGKALQALSAMLNKHGKGKVLFGVKDNGDVEGQTIGKKTIKDISVAITSRILPQVIPTILLETYDNQVVISVEVRGYNKPYSADGEYLIRSGSENRKIDPETMRELVFTTSYESITKMESFNQNLTFNQLKQLFISKGLSINEQAFEKNNSFLCENGKYNVLGNILADSNDVSIKVVRFAGDDKSEIVMRNEYGYKCLILSMQNAFEYIKSINETKVILDGNIVRKEVRLFDVNSVREAWVNACLHTKWAKQIPPAIYIYKDRMEIISTGGLPIDFSKKEFFQGISHPINKQLQKIMGQLDIVEQTGHGVLEIIRNYGREAFEITPNYIIVTFKFPFEPSFSNTMQENLNVTQKQIYYAIKNHPTITTSQLMKVTGLGSTRIHEIIKELKELGKIKRVGARKNGYWEII